jgi:hypothetical protein
MGCDSFLKNENGHIHLCSIKGGLPEKRILFSMKRLSSPRVLNTIKFFLPPELTGELTEQAYRLWLRKKSLSVCSRDKKEKRPCAKNATRAVYAGKVNEAVCRNPLSDPFTGEKFRWDLIRQYDPKKAGQNRDYFMTFVQLPTIDHINPDATDLEFELCAWLVNRCKSELMPDEFIELCEKITAYRAGTAAESGAAMPKAPALYFPPSFLEGIMTVDQYRNRLESKSHHMFVKDKRRKRKCVSGRTCAEYKMAMHLAICANGLLDPFTGEPMDWSLFGVDPKKATGENRDFMKKYGLMPTIDHKDPYSDGLDFEVCSYLVNACKNNLDPDGFVELCKKVVAFRG